MAQYIIDDEEGRKGGSAGGTEVERKQIYIYTLYIHVHIHKKKNNSYTTRGEASVNHDASRQRRQLHIRKMELPITFDKIGSYCLLKKAK